MAAERNQQLRILIEDLDAILHSIDHPDVSVAVDGHALGARKISGSVAGFAEGADESSVPIEDLDAIVERVRDVEVAFAVDR